MKVETKTQVWVRGRIYLPGEFIDLPCDVATKGVELGLFVAPAAEFSEPESDSVVTDEGQSESPQQEQVETEDEREE